MTKGLSCLIVGLALSFSPNGTKLGQGVRVDGLPQRASSIVLVEILSVAPSPWTTAEPNVEVRTVQLELRIRRVLKKGSVVIPNSMTFRSTVRQSRIISGRIGDNPDFWSYWQLEKGIYYLVFANETPGSNWSEMFSNPVSVSQVSENQTVVGDVEFIVAGEKLELQAQASRLTKLLDESSVEHTVFLGEYLGRLAVASQGTARQALLQAIANIHLLKLDEDAKAELLRTFHVGLVMQEHPPVAAVKILAAAALRTVVYASIDKTKPPNNRLHAVASSYLPWLVKTGIDLKSIRSQRLITDREAALAAQGLKQLSEVESFPPKTRQFLLDASKAIG